MDSRHCSSVARLRAAALVGLLVLVPAGTAAAQTLEVEPNDTKATATPAPSMTAGQHLRGRSVSGSGSGLDYWRVSTAALPPGIYRHELLITTNGVVGHTGTLRGLNQTGGVVGVCPANGTVGAAGTVDSAAQTSSSMRMNAWYGFGRGEQLFYRVTGTNMTTANYKATLRTAAIAPLVVPGLFAPGTISFRCSGVTAVDTDIILLDAGLNPVSSSEGFASNDDEHCQASNTLQSHLARSLTPGTYYLGVGAYNTCNDRVSPSDDDTLTGVVLDFADAVVCSSTAAVSDRDVVISDGITTYTASGVHTAKPFEILWYQFLVGNGLPGALCDPGFGGVIACPCGPTPMVAGQGCVNSLGTGASIASSGTSSLSGDTLVVSASGIGSSGVGCAGQWTSLTCTLLQGDGCTAGGIPFNAGVTCLGGSWKRLQSAASASGVFTSTAGISATSAGLGDVIAADTVRWYGVWYRDPCAQWYWYWGCTAKSSNISNTLRICWSP